MDLNVLLEGIKAGKRYILREEFTLAAKLYTSGENRYFTPSANLYRTEDEAGVYIGWRHYGSSANKLDADSLRWILDNIFKGAKPSDFVEVPKF